jgi:hypothetical protein
MGILDDLFKSISDFFGSSGTSSGSSSTSSNTISANLNKMDDIKKSVKKKYQTIDGENKLVGNLFGKLINNTNEIIGEANTKKENTNLK